jgi:hypothetical protein
MSAAASISMAEALGSLIKLDRRFSPDMGATRAAVPSRKSPQSGYDRGAKSMAGLRDDFTLADQAAGR